MQDYAVFSTHSVKLPISEDILAEMRYRLWDNVTWSDSDKEKRMKYLGCMLGFEMGARVSEYTRAEPRGSDHCVRVDYLTFIVQTPGGKLTVAGSCLAGLNTVDSAEDPRFQVLGYQYQDEGTRETQAHRKKVSGRNTVP